MPSAEEALPHAEHSGNDLVDRARAEDPKALPLLDRIEPNAGQVIFHPGDQVENVYFPCEQSLVSLTVDVGGDVEVEALLIGREGAVGALMGSGLMPAYTRSTIKVAGPLLKNIGQDTGRGSAPLAFLARTVCAVRGMSSVAGATIRRLQRRAFDRATCGQVDYFLLGADRLPRGAAYPRAACGIAGCWSQLH